MLYKLPEKLVLFDGECNFCDSLVQFLLKWNKTESLYFASLQSLLGKEILTQFQIKEDSIVYVMQQKTYTKMDAVFLILDELHPFFQILKILKILPKTIQNRLYDMCAKYRYLLFGNRKNCRVPTPEFKERFLS